MDFDFFPKLWFIFVNTLNHPNLSVSCYTPILSPCVFEIFLKVFSFLENIESPRSVTPLLKSKFVSLSLWDFHNVIFHFWKKKSESPSSFSLLLHFRLVSLSLWDFHNFILPLWKNIESPRSSRYVSLSIQNFHIVIFLIMN